MNDEFCGCSRVLTSRTNWRAKPISGMERALVEKIGKTVRIMDSVQPFSNATISRLVSSGGGTVFTMKTSDCLRRLS